MECWDGQIGITAFCADLLKDEEGILCIDSPISTQLKAFAQTNRILLVDELS